ncbi:MAG: polynucleotide adenylyltransferase PcnB, partial [Acidobacteria bacterium]|nr:polynucleotide adenylyltransferase PcnB [Acidobacteriota bacterium]
METALNPQRSSLAKTAAVSILETLRSHGHSAYLVGGCVRDLLLALAPQDYDVATSARPDA